MVPSCLQRRRPSPYSNRVGSHIGLFRGLHGVHLRCGLPARRAAKAARGLEGFDGFVTSAAAPIATGWSDQLSGRESHPLKIRAFSRRTATHAPLSRIGRTTEREANPCDRFKYLALDHAVFWPAPDGPQTEWRDRFRASE